MIRITGSSQMDPVDRVITLSPLESVKIVSSNLSITPGFILFQAHAHLDPVIMSYDDLSLHPPTVNPHLMVSGKNIGLVVHFEAGDTHAAVFLKNSNYETVNVLVITSLHSAEG